MLYNQKWKKMHRWHQKTKKNCQKCRQHPPPTLLMLKNRKIIFFQKKTEMVGNIPKCDERHRWRQKPEKKCRKRKHTPLHLYPTCKKSKNLNFFKYPRNGVKHSKILLKASQSSIMRAKGPSKQFLRTCKISKTNKNGKRNLLQLPSSRVLPVEDFDRGSQLKPNY